MSVFQQLLKPLRKDEPVPSSRVCHRRATAEDRAAFHLLEPHRSDAAEAVRLLVTLSRRCHDALLAAVPEPGDTLIPLNSAVAHPYTVRVMTCENRHVRLVYGLHHHPVRGLCILSVPSHGSSWLSGRDDHRARHTAADGAFRFDPTGAEAHPLSEVTASSMPGVIEWASNAVRFGRGLRSRHHFIGDDSRRD